MKENSDAMTQQESKPNKLSAQQWKVILVVILAPFMAQMDSTIVNVSLSSIASDLHRSIVDSQWIITGYLLALALALPMNGWLVDRMGAKKLYLSCFASFTLASFLCGTAQTLPQLIAARIFQGIAGGLLAPLTQLMMARIAGTQMVRVFAVAAAPVLLAPLFGPLIAGWILEHGSWPWLFYVNLPIGLCAFLLAIYYIPLDEGQIQKRPFDLKGFLLLSPGLACLIYGFERASHFSAVGIGVLFVGIWLALSFLKHATREADRALINPALFKNRIFSTASTIQFLSNGIMYAGQFLIPLYLTTTCGLSASSAGWILSAMGVGMLLTYPFIGRLTDRFGNRRVAMSGVVINFLGTLPFLWMAYAGYSEAIAIAGLFLRGLGQGGTGIPSVSAAYASVPKSQLSMATTSMNIVQRMGGPVITTFITIIFSFSGPSDLAGSNHSFTLPFAILIAIQLLIFRSASKLPSRVVSEKQ